MTYPGFSCRSCRLEFEEDEEEVPCDTVGTCPYDPSPGFDGHLDPRNSMAVWFYKHWQTLGDSAFQMLPDMSQTKRLLLLEQLTCLHQMVKAQSQEANDDPRRRPRR